MRESKRPLGATEIEILRIIGDHHPTTVGEVAKHVAQTTGQARTTVLTTMERLRLKGHLTRRRVKGVYRFSPKVANEKLLRNIVKDFVETTLGGSVSPFVTYLSEGGPLSSDDLDTLKRLVKDVEKQRKDKR